MLKRSLALGALMAFVITGQAWAAVTETLADKVLTFNSDAAGSTPALQASTTDNNVSRNFSEMKFTGNWTHTTDRNIFFSRKEDSNSSNPSDIVPELTLNGGKIDFTGQTIFKANGGTDGSVVFQAWDAKLTVNATTINLKNFCNAFIAQGNSSLTVIASDIYVESNTTSNIISGQAFKNNASEPVITIDTGNLTIKAKDALSAISAKDGYYNGTSGVPMGGVVKIIADGKIDIESKIGILAQNGVSEDKRATVTVEADELNIQSSEAAIKASSKAFIDVQADDIDLTAPTAVLVTGFNTGVQINATTANLNGAVNVQHGSLTVNSGSYLDINATDDYALNVHFDKANGTVNAETINITATGNLAGDAHKSHAVYVYSNGVLGVNGFNELNVNTYNKSSDAAEGGSGIITNNGGNITIIGNTEAVANVYAEGRAAVVAMGGSPGSGQSSKTSIVEINVDNLNLSAKTIENSAVRKNSVLAVQNDSEDHGGASVVITTKNLSIENLGTAESVNAIGVQGASATDAVLTINADTANIKGAIKVDGGTLNMTNIGKLVLHGLKPDSDAAIKVNGGILQVNANGKEALAIEGAEAGNTYNVVSGVGAETVLWTDESLAYDRTTMVATSNHDTNKKLYTVKYESFNDVSEVTDEIKDQFVAAVGGKEELAVPMLVAASTGQGTVMEETAPGAKEFLAAVSSDAEMPKETKAAVINSAAKLAEAGGNAGTAVSVANNVAGVTTGRMSFGGRGHGGHKGGHGVGMFEEGSGAAVWAQYMHGKDDATDMPMDGGATSYESEYDGIVVGVDFKKVGKFQSGIAFNYGEGDSNGFGSGIKTSSEYDFWGVGYYGNIRNEDTNFIFDVNYAKSDSDVTQDNPAASAAIEASPGTTTWSAGVKVEKLYQNNNVQIVPYTGLRYMSIDTDEYQSNVAGKALFNYAPERQDIWLLPLGVTIKQEVVNDNGWVVTPKVDLSYIWAFGDTDSNMSVSIPGIAASNDTLGFTVMDDGSFLGLVGVEAKLDDWTFGVSYSYQKGDYAESKKWFVDAKYSF